MITPPRLSTPSRLLVLPVAALAFLCLSAPALAGTATSSTGGDLFVFTAAPGEANHLLVLATVDGYRVVDQGAALTAGAGCIQVFANEVHCSPTENAEIYAGDMDDFVSASAEGAGLVGGEGDDVLEAGAWGNVLQGGPGDDTLRGGFGSDNLDGGAGADIMDGGPGPGKDSVSYGSRTAPVTVDGEGEGDDGEAGEGDTVLPSVEAIGGGSGDDTLSTPVGGGHLSGGGGDDTLIGSEHPDRLEGGSGDDTLTGYGRADYLGGNEGADTLRAGLGRDVAWGGPGNDTFMMRDRLRDVLRGQTGTDRARIDRGLDFRQSIERLF